MAVIDKDAVIQKKQPVYKDTKVQIVEKDGLIAVVDLNVNDMLYRDIKIKDDKDGLYVEYPTRIRVKAGKVVFDRYGQNFYDYIFRPEMKNLQHFDTLVVNAYYRAKGIQELSLSDIPYTDESFVISACAVNQMHNGFVGFAEVCYRGMKINDIAILQTPAGDKHLVFPHFKTEGPEGMEIKKLYIYPQRYEMQNLRWIIIDAYESLVR